MLDLFEITENDIQSLSDSDLRTLIGRLCEAELESLNLPTTAAMWGGDQRAADGGLDVYVDLEHSVELPGDLPRWKTGFQVKQESMPEKKVEKEMCPKGKPRSVLAELAQAGGAYIIACGTDSTSYSMMRARLRGMKTACSGIPNVDGLKLDFYDSNRISTWTRKYPSLVQWVKSRLGKGTTGWQPYANWAFSPGGVDDEFLLDDNSKIIDGSSNNSVGITALEGLNRIRKKLANECECIRITGLSGVGKTRFTQALFDPRVGESPLPKSIVCYTDISHGPSPTPLDMAGLIRKSDKRVILIVDNCPPDLHEQLVKECDQPGSKISLLTVEYDIRDDRPEKTDVYHMEPSTNELVEDIIFNRYASITRPESRRIAEFSEGNARIAIAIAETVKRGETILALRNDELFSRLFLQRNPEDQGLLKAAEVCSLIYSFDGETLGTPESELDRLAPLAEMTSIELYRHITILFNRGLAQKRGKWRAVLPHAIANRLAKQALENIPVQLIESTFKNDPSARLLKSFTRRLGYIHDSPAAQQIAAEWLKPGNLLEDISKLNDLGIELLSNLAPIAPEETLEAVERAAMSEDGEIFASRDNANYSVITRLLRKIAYDAELFQRCCRLLLKFAETEKPDENNNSIRSLTASLFLPQLSGTCAPLESRLEILAECIADDSPYGSMAIPILNKLLETWHFSSHYSFEFGARSRGYGYLPKTWDEITAWYSRVIDYSQDVILSNSSHNGGVKKVLANHFRGLWTNARAVDALEACSNAIAQKEYWGDGWVAVCQTLNFDKKRLSNESLKKLHRLEIILAPKDLYQQATIYAFTQRLGTLDITETVEGNDEEDGGLSRYERVADYTESLGQKVSQDKDVFLKLVPDLVSRDGNGFIFGKGLGLGAVDPDFIWDNLQKQLSATAKEDRRLRVFQGFLTGARTCHEKWCEDALDKAIESEPLSAYFPLIQCSVEINENAVARLFKSLKLNLADIWQYNTLSGGGQSCKIDNIQLSKLLYTIAAKEKGEGVALDIFSMRIFGEKDHPMDESLVLFGQDLCLKLCEVRLVKDSGYEIGKVIKRCFSAPSAESKARDVCRKIIECVEDHKKSRHDFSDIINTLIQVQPIAVLDELLLGYDDGPYLFSWFYNFKGNTLHLAPENTVVKWCDIDPSVRYPLVSGVTPLFAGAEEGKLSSIAPLAEVLLQKAADYPEILDDMTKSIFPSGWTNSLAATLSFRVPFLEKLMGHKVDQVRAWAKRTLVDLKVRIKKEAESEERENRARYETFE